MNGLLGLSIDLAYRPRQWQRECHMSMARFTVLALHRRAGKALDVDTPIPMAEGGFKRMGDLQAGDRVLDESGKPCHVLYAHDIMHGRRCLEFTFSDGSTVVCDEDHLWLTRTKLERAYRAGRKQDINGRMSSGTPARKNGSVRKAKEIEASIRYAGETNHSVQLCDPVQYPHRELPILPYLLGLWLGDGSSHYAGITTMDEEIRGAFAEYAALNGWSLKRHSSQNSGRATSYGITNVRGAKDSFQRRLRSLGVLGNKHVPEAYLYASKEQRVALLQGLMDTDGSISKCGRKCEITLVNQRLSSQVFQLLSSLGHKPGLSEKVIKGKTYYRVNFTPLFNPFRLSRKAERFSEPKSNSFSRNRFIVSVKEVETRPVRCITVDSPNSLYLCTASYIPTHNTELALRELLENAMTCRLTMPTYFYVAPFLKQAKTIAWARLKQIVEPLRAAALASINESELTVTLPFNGAVIRVFGADNPDAMRGVRLDGVVLDEVAQIKPEVWDEILQPTLSDRMGWALFIGTPKGVNLFSQLFYKALSGSPGWTAAKYTVYDTQAIAEEEVERLRADMTEQAFAREYLCDFTAAGDDQVLSLLEAEDAARRHYREEDYSYAPRILGCDPARFGGDRSVITRRQGLVVLKMTSHRGLNNMQLADKLAHEIDLWEADATFVDVGGGAGVIDRLIQLGHTVHEVNFGAGAADPRFLNKRSEVWWGMADWIRAGGAIPDDMELKQELATPTYSYTVSNKIQIESKDDIKKRLQGGASPDKADSLATTFAMPVQKRDIKREVFEHMGVSVSRTEREYDPFANI